MFCKMPSICLTKYQMIIVSFYTLPLHTIEYRETACSVYFVKHIMFVLDRTNNRIEIKMIIVQKYV